jgi:hypothetical protein
LAQVVMETSMAAKPTPARDNQRMRGFEVFILAGTILRISFLSTVPVGWHTTALPMA